jgi:hypothetical protein
MKKTDMSYRREILKPFYDALVSFGFTEKKFGIAIATSFDPVKPWKKDWYFPKIHQAQYHRQITDDFIDVVAITIEGTDKVFRLSISLAVIVLSIERPSAVLMEASLGFELGGSFTIASDLITKNEPMPFAESKRDNDVLEVNRLVDMITDVAIPFFENHTTLESLLPDLKAARKSDHPASMIQRTKYVSLPLTLIFLKRSEEAFDHLLKLEEMRGTIYENMSKKLKKMFPELT